jgi:hypothetical protein
MGKPRHDEKMKDGRGRMHGWHPQGAWMTIIIQIAGRALQA